METTHRSEIFAAADELVEQYAKSDPMAATYLGVPGLEREMPDFSMAHLEEQAKMLREAEHRVRALVPIDDVDRIARDVMVERCEAISEHIESGEEARSFAVLMSPVWSMRQVLELMTIETADDAENLRQRMTKIPDSMDTWRSTLADLGSSKSLPAQRHVLGVAQQAELQSQGGYVKLAERLGAQAGVDPAASGLIDAAHVAQRALVELAAYLRTEIAPLATTIDGCGAERYERRTRYMAGASIDVQEAYAWGYEDLRRITERMHELASSLAPSASSLRAAADELDADPARVVHGTDAILDRLRALTQEAIEQLDTKYFDIDPRIRVCDARLAPEGSATAPYYVEPNEDLSRPGTTWLPTGGKTEFPWWRLVSTWYHEGVPGHHLQLATCVVNREDQSRFQRTLGGNSAYVEGWALYAERLMHELGFFEDPAAEYGFLSSQAFRAARVVVDIGMHLGLKAPSDLGVLGDLGDCSSKVWTPEMAVSLLEEWAIIEPEDARSEVDRYLGWPGQAITYKIGERAWLDARKRARTRLGDSFDLKGFHNFALSTGSLGLDQFAEEMGRFQG